jgi:ribonuclease HI
VWQRSWRLANEKDVARILQEEMAGVGEPAGPRRSHIRRDADEEMRRAGVGNSQVREYRGSGGEAQGILDAWDRAWDRVKEELTTKVRKKIKVKSKFAWVNDKVRTAWHDRNAKQRATRAPTATESDRIAYREAKAVAQRVYRRERMLYIQDHWRKAGPKTMSREHWTFINSLMGRKARQRTEPDLSPDEVNSAFLGKVKKLREPLDSQPWPQIPVGQGDQFTEFERVTAQEAWDALATVRGTASSGEDELPMAVLKRLRKVVCEPVARIANAVAGGSWPERWKRAEIIPLWKKKGSRNDPRMYRPIALLPAVSRIVEKILAEQIKAHARRNGLLPPCQYAYRPGHCGEHAMTHIVQEIAEARGRGETAVVCSADCSAAFDSISHKILLEKISTTCGMRGQVHKLLGTYLRDRKQRVRLTGGRTGAWMDNPWGVPQGSVWGPLAFSLYTADLPRFVTAAKIVMYADDVTLVTTAKEPEEAVRKMNIALAQLEEYNRRNRIAAAPEKTQLMVSSSTRSEKALGELACAMGEQQISPARVIKVLGVLIDQQLTWDDHSATAARRSDNAAFAIARAAGSLRQEDRAALMRALAHPHLDGNMTALANPSAMATDRLRRAYNRTARVAVWGRGATEWWMNGQGRKRSNDALTKLKWLQWDQRRAAVRANYTARIYHRRTPEHLRSLLPTLANIVVQDRVMTRSQARRQVPEEVRGNTIHQKAISQWGPRVLNAIARDAVYEGCLHGKPEERKEPVVAQTGGKPPPDTDAKERAGWYAYLRDQYKDKISHRQEGREVVWTDGSADTIDGERKAGAGIFYGVGNERNAALRVPGRQTSARAELYALCQVLRTNTGPLTVKSDCRYVVDGTRNWRQKWRAEAWFAKPLSGTQIANTDLWREIDRLLEVRREAFDIEWTKGHPLPRHLGAAVTTEVDAWGNIGSDYLAGEAVKRPEESQRGLAAKQANRPGTEEDQSGGKLRGGGSGKAPKRQGDETRTTGDCGEAGEAQSCRGAADAQGVSPQSTKHGQGREGPIPPRSHCRSNRSRRAGLRGAVEGERQTGLVVRWCNNGRTGHVRPDDPSIPNLRFTEADWRGPDRPHRGQRVWGSLHKAASGLCGYIRRIEPAEAEGERDGRATMPAQRITAAKPPR